MEKEDIITKIKKERKSIISEYSTRLPKRTHIDEEALKQKDIQEVEVKDIIDETEDTKTFILSSLKEEKNSSLMPFKAGQYITLFLTIDDKPVSRAYSLASSPTLASKGIYKIAIKRVTDGLVSNYMLDEIKVGDHLHISMPSGNFSYNPIRDEKNVIAIAGGSGITPFMALANAVIDDIYDINLTIFYSVKKYDDIIFRNEIENINKKSKKVKFVITLTREEKEGYLTGHITQEMLAQHLQEFNTIFMCGPKELYQAMNEILGEFNIPRKSVHYENFFVNYEPEEYQEYNLKVLIKDEVYETICRNDETLLVAMEKAAIKAPSLCRVGECGYCRSILIDGKVKMIGALLKKAEAENDYIHPCVAYPDSDIVLRLDI